MASDNLLDEKSAAEGDVVSIKLPAPAGWTKKFTPKKEGTPGRSEIIFIAPTGEEIKSKTQLKSYFKSHPGGPNFKEFDWTTGDTPRRSSRLSEKSKASESPDNDTPKKRQRKLSAMEEADGDNENETADENEATHEIEATDEEAKGAAEVPAADAEDMGEYDDKEVVTEVTLPQNDDVKASVQISPEGEAATEEQNSDAQEHEVAAKEQGVAAMVQEAAAEGHEVALEEQKTVAEELQAALKEQKAADHNMETQLGTNDNDAIPLDKEDVQLKPNENKDGDINEEDKLVSDAKLSNGEEGAENATIPSALAEEPNEDVPGGDMTMSFGASTGMVLDGVEGLLSTQANANVEQSADKGEPVDPPKYTADHKVDSAVVADKDSLKTNKAENQNTTEIDTAMSS